MTGPTLTLVDGTVFEDTIDGYFPLHLSLRQMLDRTGFAAALVILRHAPIMHLPGLPEDAPVPLRLPGGQAGLIRRLMVLVSQDGTRTPLQGVGRWGWFGPEVPLGPDTRLGEPAFLRGIGFKTAIDGASGAARGMGESRIALAHLPQPTRLAGLVRDGFGWSDCRVWTVPTQAGFVAETPDISWGTRCADQDGQIGPGRVLLTVAGATPAQDIAQKLAEDG